MSGYNFTRSRVVGVIDKPIVKYVNFDYDESQIRHSLNYSISMAAPLAIELVVVSLIVLSCYIIYFKFS